MADSGTLATTAQVLLAIGEDATATQVLEANTNYWILYAESEIEAILSKTKGEAVGVVANYSSITSTMKQWLAMGASHLAAWYGINQNQGAWQLSITQSKLNIIDATVNRFIKRLEDPDVIELLGL